MIEQGGHTRSNMPTPDCAKDEQTRKKILCHKAQTGNFLKSLTKWCKAEYEGQKRSVQDVKVHCGRTQNLWLV